MRESTWQYAPWSEDTDEPMPRLSKQQLKTFSEKVGKLMEHPEAYGPQLGEDGLPAKPKNGR